MARARLSDIIDKEKLEFLKFRNHYMTAISYQKQINSAQTWGVFSGYTEDALVKMQKKIKDFDAVELKKLTEMDVKELDIFLEQKFKAEQAKKEAEKVKVLESKSDVTIAVTASPHTLSTFDQIVGLFSSGYLERRKAEIKKAELDELKLRQEQRKKDLVKQKK